MFYRQKVLLALTEAVGGSLSNADLEKLLFLFCQESSQPYYGFFPYESGASSFMSYYDKRKLVEKGHLKISEHFELTGSMSYREQLKPAEQQAIEKFVATTQNLRGGALVKKTYLKYPAYASRSTIVSKILTAQEHELVQMSWNHDHTPKLFTIGYEGQTIDDYLRDLTFNNIQVLVDVRRNPLSRKHGFSKKKMQNYLERVGMKYVHLPSLGIESQWRKNLTNRSAYKALFERYEREVIPLQQTALSRIVDLMQVHGRVALTCFEADHLSCHRHKIVDALVKKPDFQYAVEHI